MVGIAKTKARPITAMCLKPVIDISSPSQCRSLIWDELSPVRRKYSTSRTRSWLSRVSDVKREKTRLTRDMPQTHMHQSRKKSCRPPNKSLVFNLIQGRPTSLDFGTRGALLLSIFRFTLKERRGTDIGCNRA